jgi:hypothetical protein
MAKHIPNGHKNANIYHWNDLQNLGKLGFLVWKHTIWQPWFVAIFVHLKTKVTSKKVTSSSFSVLAAIQWISHDDHDDDDDPDSWQSSYFWYHKTKYF